MRVLGVHLTRTLPITNPASSHARRLITQPAHLRRSRFPPPTRSATNPDLDSLLGELDVPDIEADLGTYQTDDGAVFGDDGAPLTFRNDGYAMEALEKGVVASDLSHWGRIRLGGSGARAFLHGQSTNDIGSIEPGSGCETVLVTPQARGIDLLTAYVQPTGVLCVTSPETKETIMTRLDKHIFPTDQVHLADISPHTVMFALLGPGSDALLKELAAEAVVGQPWWSHTVLGVAGKPVIVAVGALLSTPGYTLIADETIGADLWRSLVAKGAVPMGTAAWETARVINGRPAAGKELTQDYNPLEAGLYHAVSVDKGCYVGQETISKVHTLGAVKQQLWGLDLQAPCTAGDEVKTLDGRKLGRVTSAADVATGGHRALAYLKCKGEGGARLVLHDLEVEVAGVKGRVIAIPYATRSFPDGAEGGRG